MSPNKTPKMKAIIQAIWEQLEWLPFWTFRSGLHYLISGIFFYFIILLCARIIERDQNTIEEWEAGAGGYMGLGILFTFFWPFYLIYCFVSARPLLVTFLVTITVLLSGYATIHYLSK